MQSERPHVLPAALLGLLVLLCPGDSEAAWSINGIPVSGAVNDQVEPVIVSDAAGGAIISWLDGRFGNDDVYAQRINGNGSVLWSGNGIPVCTESSSQRDLASVLDRFGGAVMAWCDTRANNRGIYAQRINSAGTPLWSPDGIKIASDISVFQTRLISDGGNGLVVPTGFIAGWHSQGTGTFAIRVQHFNVDGTVFWGASGTTLVSSSAAKWDLSMTHDGGGLAALTRGVVLAWTQDSNGNTNIAARRIDGAGTQLWASNGVNVCAATGDQDSPQITQVTGNQTITVWVDRRTPEADIYAQKLDGSGVPLWLANGLPVCRASGNQTAPQILSDNAGGAWVVWLDQRDSATPQIYGQRLDTNGQPVWAVDGVLLAPTSGALDGLKIMSDNAGGAIIVWHDTQNGGDVRAQRINGNGTLQWGSAGVQVTGAAGGQFAPAILTDGANGLIAAWQDERSGTADIYANRIVSTLVDVAVAPPAGFELAIASPNPTRGGARLRLGLPEAAGVTIDVLDTAGRRVRRLAAGRFEAGRHTVDWDGADESGAQVGSGMFFVRALTGTRSTTSRIVVLR